MSDFKNLRNSIILSSFGAASVGVILWFTPAKPLANWVVGASIGGLIAVEFVTGTSERRCKKQIEIFETEVQKLTFNLEAERGLVLRQKQELTSQGVVSQKLAEELQQLKLVISTLREQLKNYQSEIKSLQTANGEAATEIMQDSFQEFQSRLNALIASLAKRYPNLQKDWEALRHEFDSYIRIFAARVHTVIGQPNAQELIKMSLAMQHEIISTGATLKVKAYKAIVTYLTREFDGVIFREEHETLLEELNAAWQKKNQAIATTYQKNFEAIKQEFGQVADSVVTGYREDFKSIVDEGLTQVEQIEELQKNIVWLQGRLEEASKPHRFPAAVEQSRVGNAIIDYYYRTHIVLDGIDWDDTETGYKLMFHVGRNGSRFISADMLNANDAPQKLKEVSGAINVPEFKHNTRGGHVFLEIQTRHPKKKDTTKDDIYKLGLIPASQFCDRLLVATDHTKKGKPTLRVMAATGDGKGIAVKNLIAHYLTLSGWEIWLSDPVDDSDEDYWYCAKVATNSREAGKAYSKFVELHKTRQNKLPAFTDNYVLGVFDEFDKQHNDKDKEDAKALMTAIRHTKQRQILIGQCSEVGANHWTWNDMSNCAMLCLEGSIGQLIKHYNDLGWSLTKKREIQKQYEKLAEWARLNNESDDIPNENAYRIGLLAVGDRYEFLEIPSAHKGILRSGAGLIRESLAIDLATANPDVSILCPHCGHDEHIKKGKLASGKQQYACKACNKKFSV
jgi:hypothetical protein